MEPTPTAGRYTGERSGRRVPPPSVWIPRLIGCGAWGRETPSAPYECGTPFNGAQNMGRDRSVVYARRADDRSYRTEKRGSGEIMDINNRRFGGIFRTIGRYGLTPHGNR